MRIVVKAFKHLKFIFKGRILYFFTWQALIDAEIIISFTRFFASEARIETSLLSFNIFYAEDIFYKYVNIGWPFLVVYVRKSKLCFWIYTNKSFWKYYFKTESKMTVPDCLFSIGGRAARTVHKKFKSFQKDQIHTTLNR